MARPNSIEEHLRANSCLLLLRTLDDFDPLQM